MSDGNSGVTTSTRRGALAMGMGLAAGLSLPASLRAAQPPSEPKGQVVAGLSQEPTVFHPLMPGIEVDQGVWWQLFSTLWYIDPEGRFQPDLAKEVPTLENGGLSADGLTWKIKLRNDAKWHDGTPFTAEDVKFSIDLVNNTAFRARNRVGHSLVHDIKIVAPDEIHWRMQSAYSPYMSILSLFFIVPKHALEKASDPNASPFNNAPIGTGPFRWGERVPGDHIQLLANKSYHGRGPFLERIVFKYVPDLTVLYTQFRTGQIDYTGIQGVLPNFVKEAKTLPGRRVTVSPTASVEHIAPNLEFGPLADKSVREALYLAVNKKGLIDALNYGLPVPTESFVPQQAWAFTKDLPAHSHDPAKANAILDAAGWKRGSGGIREKNGVRLEFANSTTSGNAVREQTQQLLMQDWKAIGASLRISNMPAAVIWGDFWQQSKFQSVIVGVNFMLGSDPDVTPRFHSSAIPAKGGRGYNTYQFQNKEADRLMELGASQFDLAERKKTYAALQKLIREEFAILPLFQAVIAEGTKEGLQGYAPNINTSSNCWNMREWYWG
ncbi:ABC transporter substrate-binding protein [Hyphomicrobiales bacterium]|nr:ABC transporter substrate-binding protein [Hyphomicrobiales bacterium]CAH1700502.1 ABC transporter substrate-binding protein [Hyphomicrobiales bacterium]CAI0344352.1 peptide/nickel transport system substrate-binding protein [Hyphomicrobiales bacterium]